jgi:ankyrin repeat protein
MHNHVEAAKLLLQKGAEINAMPPGFHFAGSSLHNAAGNGHRAMVEFLIDQGADANMSDQAGDDSPADWARYGGHWELSAYIEQTANGR